MSILKSRSHCSLVILTQTFFLGIENLGQGETDCLPCPAAAKQQARRITPYKNVTSCPKFKSRSLNYQCYFSLVLLNCTMAFALHTVTESSELQESCAFKIQGRSKNWSGPDPTDPTGSAGPGKYSSGGSCHQGRAAACRVHTIPCLQCHVNTFYVAAGTSSWLGAT